MPAFHALTAILPCNNLDASEAFYNRLGFTRPDSEKPTNKAEDTYRILSDGKGGHLHLTDAVEGWLVPGRNPFGLYLYTEAVDARRGVQGRDARKARAGAQALGHVRVLAFRSRRDIGAGRPSIRAGRADSDGMR
jgi:hypothetical protein